MRYGVFDKNRLAVIIDQSAVDVTDLLSDTNFGAGGPLASLIKDGSNGKRFVDELASRPKFAVADKKWLAPLPAPNTIIAAPLNYNEHVKEMSSARSIAELGIFLKASASVIGPGDTVQLPYIDKRTDQEGELAVIIGREARHVSTDEALDYVFGYTCLLDITLRSTEDRSTRKSFDTFTPIGPWVVSADEIPNPGDLRLRTWVNDELRQETSTGKLIFGVPELIAYASSIMTLRPGDVIATGTPAGVGPLQNGDLIVVEISGVGKLQVNVSNEQARKYDARPGR